MNTTEDRARAAMRAIARTVDDAPPLRLPRRHSAAPAPRARRLRWRLWIAPLAAAMASTAIAVTLVACAASQASRQCRRWFRPLPRRYRRGTTWR